MQLKNILKQERFNKLNKALFIIFGVLILGASIYYKYLFAGIIGACLIIGGIAYGKNLSEKSANTSGQENMKNLSEVIGDDEDSSKNAIDDDEDD